jgi:hypothetical protein
MSKVYHLTVCFLSLFVAGCGADSTAPPGSGFPSAWELERIGTIVLPAPTANGTVLADSLDIQSAGIYRRVLRIETSPGPVLRVSSSGTWSASGNSLTLDGSIQGTEAADHATLAITWHTGELSVYRIAAFQLF